LEAAFPTAYAQTLGKHDDSSVVQTTNSHFQKSETEEGLDEPGNTKRDRSGELISSNYEHLSHNLVPAVEGVRGEVCFYVHKMPTALLQKALEQYGNLEKYTKSFELHARPIVLSKTDGELREACELEMEKGKKVVWEESDDAILCDWALEQQSIDEENLLRANDLQGGGGDTEGLSEGDKELVRRVVEEARNKQKKGRKASGKGKDSDEQIILDFYKEHQIDPWWLRSTRCTYMMDAWNVLPKETGHLEGDHTVTPPMLRAAGRLSADSKWLETSGQHLAIQMQDLVAKCLKIVLGGGTDGPSKKPAAKKPAAKKPAAEISAAKKPPAKKKPAAKKPPAKKQPPAKKPAAKQPTAKKKPAAKFNSRERPRTRMMLEDEEKIDFRLDDMGYKHNLDFMYYLDGGILKQGKMPVHQELHLDNARVADWDITKRIWLGEDVTAEEWLKCGYVVDMPLSTEGSWLRVAIPDPTTKTFYIDWVYVPYGSFLVRSMALFHSGHYGSPGNTRYHATFSIQETRVDAGGLLYFKYLRDKEGFEDWKLRWKQTVPKDCRRPDGYQRICNNTVKALKAGGTIYYKKHIDHSSTFLYEGLLTNVSPYILPAKAAARGTLKKSMGNNNEAREEDPHVKKEGQDEGEGPPAYMKTENGAFACV
jgi:hypothetical protein